MLEACFSKSVLLLAPDNYILLESKGLHNPVNLREQSRQKCLMDPYFFERNCKSDQTLKHQPVLIKNWKTYQPLKAFLDPHREQKGIPTHEWFHFPHNVNKPPLNPFSIQKRDEFL